MSNTSVSMKMSPKAAGALYMKNIKQEERIAELEAEVKYIKLEAVETDAECDAMTGKIAELETDLAFYKGCMKSGENAKDSDAPSQRPKALKEQDNG
jgi:hypothetical protein